MSQAEPDEGGGSSARRPMTASRPMTSASRTRRPLTAQVQDQNPHYYEEEEEWDEEDDEDEGMFSFAPPPESDSISGQPLPTTLTPSTLQSPAPIYYQPTSHSQQPSIWSQNALYEQQQQRAIELAKIQHSNPYQAFHQSNSLHSYSMSPSDPSSSPIVPTYPPAHSAISPSAAIAAQYQQTPETRHRKGGPNSATSPPSSLQSRAFTSAIPTKATTPNTIDDAPVIQLRPGFNTVSWRAARDGDVDSFKSGSSHSLHKLDYYSDPLDQHHNPDSPLDANRGPSSVKMTELNKRGLTGNESVNGPTDYRFPQLSSGVGRPTSGGEMKYAESHSRLTTGVDAYNLEDFDMDEEDSPYPEVRASVSNIDDPEMPCLTFRAWLLGIFFVIICGAFNMFFQLRYPAPTITPVVIQIISYPAGKLCASLLPDTVYRMPGGSDRPKRTGFFGILDRIWPKWLAAGSEWSLNPGPFNIKEHTVIAIMANAAVGPVYAVNTTLVMEKFYHRAPGLGIDFCLALATQLLGFSLAGLTRRFLIWPASMIWPSNLVVCTLLNTFHAEDDDGSDGSLTRFKFFMYVSIGAFVWYWVPGYLFTALSTFSWVCWIAPRNRLINQLFGSVTGLGLGILTFDWSQIAYINSPLITPWWAEVNIFCGFAFFFWFLGPLLYYTNTWQQAYLPIGGTSVYDRYGKPYNTSRVVDLRTGLLNLTAYHEYSPLFLPTTFTAVYSIAFALATSAIVHTFLYHGHSIWDKVKNIKTEDEDVHAKLMRNYPEVPDWWYWSYFFLFTGFSVIVIEAYATGLPIWGLFLALSVALVYVLPGGFIFAMTSQQISINLVAEIIPGYLFPGKPFANMLFKTFSVQSLFVAMSFIQDLKLGHYMKIPPRVTFVVQILAAISSAIVQVGVKEFLVATVPDLCDKHQANLLTCPNSSVFYSASVLWGLLGPQRQFGQGTIYRPIVYFTIIGGLIPIPFYLFTKRWPNSWLKYVNIPVLLVGACWIPPATAINYTSWIIVGFIFQYVFRRTKFRWWSKYNFVLSAGLDVGTVISAIVIFLTVQLFRPGSDATLNWWGNTVYVNTDDFDGVPLIDPPIEGFGPLTWL
ncbi:OPT oligopeptide transporter protein-domain-containing protein [Melampsora americana]|nr:OPT oligopeptide transporter protein-domain-containing protein [Melampsora americana]